MAEELAPDLLEEAGQVDHRVQPQLPVGEGDGHGRDLLRREAADHAAGVGRRRECDERQNRHGRPAAGVRHPLPEEVEGAVRLDRGLFRHQREGERDDVVPAARASVRRAVQDQGGAQDEERRLRVRRCWRWRCGRAGEPPHRGERRVAEPLPQVTGGGEGRERRGEVDPDAAVAGRAAAGLGVHRSSPGAADRERRAAGAGAPGIAPGENRVQVPAVAVRGPHGQGDGAAARGSRSGWDRNEGVRRRGACNAGGRRKNHDICGRAGRRRDPAGADVGPRKQDEKGGRAESAGNHRSKEEIPGKRTACDLRIQLRVRRGGEKSMGEAGSTGHLRLRQPRGEGGRETGCGAGSFVPASHPGGGRGALVPLWAVAGRDEPHAHREARGGAKSAPRPGGRDLAEPAHRGARRAHQLPRPHGTADAHPGPAEVRRGRHRSEPQRTVLQRHRHGNLAHERRKPDAGGRLWNRLCWGGRCLGVANRCWGEERKESGTPGNLREK
mmetsp:Transcript_25578/g.64458  ORF Transcript_25578/g.64458 Transcript_25578/m.64458 type:complete len:498 (-) Transcript_25578:474-1967(-)